MASTIIGVGRKLTWDDFPESEPPDDAKHFDAGTAVAVAVSGFGPNTLFAGSGRPAYYVPDAIIVQVTLGPSSFKSPRVAKMSARGRASLLAHEQGHYDIHALMARDHFYELVTMAGRYYDNQADITSRLRGLKATYTDRISEIQTLYDTDTEHNLDGDEQAIWLRALRRAKRSRRQPVVKGRNGKPLEQRLLDVLRDMKLLV